MLGTVPDSLSALDRQRQARSGQIGAAEVFLT